MASATSLLQIPEEVFLANVFPQFGVNELLKLRRVCRSTKYLSDDSLRRHPRSKNLAIFYIPETEDPESFSNLKKLLLKEDELKQNAAKIGADEPIRKPISRMRLELQSPKIFGYPEFQSFWSRYGNQLSYLEIYQIHLPMTSEEFNLFESLPNLKFLEISEIAVATEHPNQPTIFPRVFSRLTTLKIEYPRNVGFDLVNFCKNIETLGLQMCYPECLQRLTHILSQNKHKKLKFLNMEQQFVDFEEHPEVIPQLCELLAKWKNLKLLNVNSKILAHLNRSESEQLAPRILSLKDFVLPLIYTYNFDTLPNVTSMKLYIRQDTTAVEAREEAEFQEIARYYGINGKSVTPESFPKLTKLELRLPHNKWISHRLAHFWQFVPNLEELKFSEFSKQSISDAAFLGRCECYEPPFLVLSKLKKLDLGVVRVSPQIDAVTDLSFIQVFSKMSLEEFRFYCGVPLLHITSTGIRALAAGRFRETVQIFPFQYFELDDVSEEELMELAGLFPCNQHLSRDTKVNIMDDGEDFELSCSFLGSALFKTLRNAFGGLHDLLL